jgi:hypothetical protein
MPWVSDIVTGAPTGSALAFILIRDAGSIIGKAVGFGGVWECCLAKSATLGASNPPGILGFGSLFKSGVPKALKRVSKLIASFFIASSASLPLFETSSWPSVVKFSNMLGFKALDIYSNKPIMPSIINNVVPGFMAPLRTSVFLKIDERWRIG